MKNNIFINKYVMACAISIVIALVGYISMSTLPVEQYPDIAPPTVQVSTSYTGADENTVMKSVIQPLEENINGVNDMTYMTSKASSNGDVEINVYFKQGSDPDMATVNVQNRVTRAQSLLPAEVNKVGVKVEKRQNNILQIFAVRSADGKYDEDFVSNYVDINITPRLMRINGVGNVQGLGNTYALRIWLKPDVMAQYGLTPNDVFNAIGGQSFVSAVGTLGELSGNSYQYSMQYKGTLKTVEEFNDIVLRTSGGGILHLDDVAEVQIGAMSYNFTSGVRDHDDQRRLPVRSHPQCGRDTCHRYHPCGARGVLLPAEHQGHHYSLYLDHRIAVGYFCCRINGRLLAQHPDAVCSRAGYRYGGG